MNKSKGKEQHYAFDSNNNLVHIKHALKGKVYYCPNCNQEMITKQGPKMEWHYAHKNLTIHCSYETYLHELAKIKLQNKFLNSESFIVELPVPFICLSSESCAWFGKGNCIKIENNLFDLKRLSYKNAYLEKKFGDFKADIMLTRCESEKDPIFIEIKVTHPCDEAKKKSGIRIIELEINSEEDIDNLVNAEIIKNDEKMSLYGFHPKDIKKDLSGTNLFWRVSVFKSNKFFKEYVNCKKLHERNKNVLIEITAPHSHRSFSIDLYAIYLAYKKYQIKNCKICKFVDGNTKIDLSITQVFCCMYKRLQINSVQEYTYANECKAFVCDEKLFKIVLNDLKNRHYRTWIDPET